MKKMKKILVLTIVCSMLTSLGGCSKRETKSLAASLESQCVSQESQDNSYLRDRETKKLKKEIRLKDRLRKLRKEIKLKDMLKQKLKKEIRPKDMLNRKRQTFRVKIKIKVQLYI